MLRKLWYVPLEPYENRYTFQLLEWSKRQFTAQGVDFSVIPGIPMTDVINIGQVLDAFGRPFWAMAQVQVLLKKLSNNEITSDDFILFEDMFHPGIESLFYAIDQMRYVGKERFIPKIGMRCLAQTIDPDDFVHYTKMERWMRYYEKMVVKCIDILFVASSEMMGYIKAAGWKIPIVVTGLPFCKEEVLERVGNKLVKWEYRDNRIVFASRIAKEKNPNFLSEFARMIHARLCGTVEVAILSGSVLDRKELIMFYPKLAETVDRGIITIYDNLKKNDYYELLNTSRVLFNCSYQDWVSNTASEADTLGCNLLFPAYRSFPEALNADAERMYIPWNPLDAVNKAEDLLREPLNQGLFSMKQNATNYTTLLTIKNLM